MKIALCFIINYDHILNKEHIWREWIEPNKDIINVYFYYKDFTKIKSTWIKKHCLPPNYIYETTYFHVMPAYMSLLKFASLNDEKNKWFCMLTDSCCPIISPKRFRYLFYNYSNNSLFSWKYAWWNPYYHKRGNLFKLPKQLWLANDPWFVITRENARQMIQFMNQQKTITKIIWDGGLANESYFAIVFKLLGEYENIFKRILCVTTHITDWNRPSSTTSPHLFKDADEDDISFIDKELERNNYAIFIRKISPEFPDEILRHYIYQYNKEKDDQLILTESIEIIMNRYNYIIKSVIYILSLAIIVCILNFYFV
jgi:hypothetical protein